MNGNLHLPPRRHTGTLLPERLWRPSTLLLLACVGLCAALALFAVGGAPGAHAQQQQRLAPLVNQDSPGRIPDEYIIVFEKGTPRSDVRAAQNTVRGLGGRVKHVYTKTINGFSAHIPPQALEAVRRIPRVAYIESNQRTKLTTIQNNPPKGLDRTSERLGLDNRYTYSETGSSVHAYIIDTGIRASHTDFGGRVSGGVGLVADGHGTDDCQSHGTHVAGIAGGSTYGIAKQVSLHPVRVFGCGSTGSVDDAIAGVDWVTDNRVLPAVANMSLAVVGSTSTTLDDSVTDSIASGVTYVIAAGNDNVDACNVSPARVAAAITVGNIDPTNDTRAFDSNFGACLDLFAPGEGILSVGIANDTATATKRGTSMAAPHVAGVAARYLQNHTAATPAQVWAAIHNADNVTGTPAAWGGVQSAGAGSPNELLHWGSLDDGYNDGDPHIKTVDGTHYDFQAAGEFVALRDGGTEIQTRQTAISTSFFPGPNGYTGIASCVSVNTAVAARVNGRRVTYQPNLSGVPDPSGLELRVDGALAALGPNGVDLGNGGRVVKTADAGGVEIDFPDGTALVVIPGWWPSQGKWYLNVRVFHTPAEEGIMGALAQGSWLPALPDGTNVGPRPAAVGDRYDSLYRRFGDAWRVTAASSLFDYAPGTSTDTFTLASWPPQSGPCTVPDTPVAQPLERAAAEDACRLVKDKDMHGDCVFDVMVTGERGFAATYLVEQREVEKRADGGNNPNPNTPSNDRWALFLDAGANFPHSPFSSVFDTGFSFNAGLEYMFTPHFSAEGIFGYHRFTTSGGGGANLFQFSANAKTYLVAPPNKLRPFVNGGIGAYTSNSGTTRFGGNVGGGLLYEVTPKFGLQGSYNYHAVNTPGTAFKFSTLQGGVRFVF